MLSKLFNSVYGFILVLIFIVALGCQPEPVETTHSNGKVKSRGLYSVDKEGQSYKEGQWKYWHDNGQLSEEGGYSLGKRTGLWKYYSKKGSVTEMAHYKDGQLHGQRTLYDKNGHPVSTEDYVEGKKQPKQNK